LNPLSKKVLQDEKEILIGKDVSIEQLNNEFIKKSKTILQLSVGADVLMKINSNNLSQAINLILSCDGTGSLKEWKESFEILLKFKDQDSIEKFKVLYTKRFPFSSPLN